MRIYQWMLALLISLHAVGISLAQEYTPEQVPNVQLQDARLFVSDPTGHIGDEDKQRINHTIATLRDSLSVEMAVVILPQIKDNDPERFAHDLFQLWGIGKKADNNGLLLLYVYQQPGRAIRFEVGYGLEGILTDALTSQISRKYIIPHILEGRVGQGILEGTQVVRHLLDDSYTAPEENFDSSGEWSPLLQLLKWWFYLSIGFSAIIILSLVYLTPKKTPLSEYISTKDGIDPKLGCVYLLFPLVLLFIIPWYKKRKDNSYTHLHDCPECHTLGSVSIHQASATSPELSPLQQTEVRIGSKDYMTAHCSACNYREVASSTRRDTLYYVCPSCSGRTWAEGTTQRISPYTKITEWRCAYCNHRSTVYDTKSRTPWVGGGGFGSGGGSFGGGSWGGGSSGGGGSTIRF